MESRKRSVLPRLFFFFFFFFSSYRSARAEKSLLSTFRLGRKEDEAASSPAGSRKVEKDASPSPNHPFGIPRRSESSDPSSPSLSAVRKKRSSSAAIDTQDVLPTSETTEDSESSATSSSRADEIAPSASSPPASNMTPGTPPPAAAAVAVAAAAALASQKIAVHVSLGGAIHEFEYAASWQVRAVMANIATKVAVDKNAALFHPVANVYLEPQRELQNYWDTEPGTLHLSLLSTKAPSSKEVKVKIGPVKRAVPVMKTTTALGVVMETGEDMTNFRPSAYVLNVADKPQAPLTPVWKSIGSEWSVTPMADLPAVNLRVHFVDDQVFKVLKVAPNSRVRGMLEACRKKWIVKIQDGSASVEYGFWLKDDGEWLSQDTFAYTLADRHDIEFKKVAPVAASSSTAAGSSVGPGTASVSSANLSASSAAAASASSTNSADLANLAVGGARLLSGSSPNTSAEATLPAVPLTEKAKKARREKIDKEVALFLQRRPPNSASSTVKPEPGKRKPIDCNLNYDVIDYCLDFLEKQNVLDLEGIYRISGNSDTVRHVWAALCLGYFDYLEWQDTAGEIAHVVTGACKLYLRELEVPLLPWDTHAKFLAAEVIPEADKKLETVTELVGNLNAVSQHTLRRLTFHLWEVAKHEKVNRMSPGNLAIVFGPTIMRPEVQDIAEMLTNSTKVDLCTYMILNREKLFDLEKLKPMTERTLGPMPVMDDAKASGAGASKAVAPSLRKGKSVKDKMDEVEKPAQAPAVREAKKSIGSALQVGTTRKAQNPRDYSNALQAMLADLMPEVVAGSMVFIRQMEVDPKAFRKHLKSLPPDQLIDLIHNLAKHVSSAPSGASRTVGKTIKVGASDVRPPPVAVPAASAGAAPAGPSATALAATATAVSAVASPSRSSLSSPAATTDSKEPSPRAVADEDDVPRPSRPPPSIVQVSNNVSPPTLISEPAPLAAAAEGGEELDVEVEEDELSKHSSAEMSFVELHQPVLEEEVDEEDEIVIEAAATTTAAAAAVHDSALQDGPPPRPATRYAEPVLAVTEDDEDEVIIVSATPDEEGGAAVFVASEEALVVAAPAETIGEEEEVIVVAAATTVDEPKRGESIEMQPIPAKEEEEEKEEEPLEESVLVVSEPAVSTPEPADPSEDEVVVVVSAPVEVVDVPAAVSVVQEEEEAVVAQEEEVALKEGKVEVGGGEAEEAAPEPSSVEINEHPVVVAEDEHVQVQVQEGEGKSESDDESNSGDLVD